METSQVLRNLLLKCLETSLINDCIIYLFIIYLFIYLFIYYYSDNSEWKLPRLLLFPFLLLFFSSSSSFRRVGTTLGVVVTDVLLNK